jgi:predicted phosphate transport protein (TIGR00153 family)
VPVSLIPRERRFYDLFDRQIDNVASAAKLLLATLQDMSTLAEHQQDIKNLEHAGDELTHELVSTLNRTFVTPFDREDIYALASGLDDVLDYIDEIAETMLVYGISEVSEAAREMAALLDEAVRELQSAISKLESRDDALKHGIEVHRIENLGDRASRRAIGELFSGTHDPITVIKLKEFYTLLENSLDRCEDVAEVIENITIKNA